MSQSREHTTTELSPEPPRARVHQLAPRFAVPVIGLLLAGFGLRLMDLTLQDIWWDEARNLDVALRPFTEIATAPELDIHPPLYFWLLHIWLQIGGAEMGQAAAQIAFLGRFFSVLGGMLAVALLFALGRRLGNVQGGMMTVLIGALSPFWLAESQETRMYTVGFALVAGAGLALLSATVYCGGATRVWLRERVWRLLPYVVLGAAALLVHYNVGFVLAAWHLWWLIWAFTQPRRWSAIGENVGAGVAILLLVAPIFPIALRQIPTYANPNLIIPSAEQYLGENWRAYFGGYAADSVQLMPWMNGWLWTLAALIAVSMALWGARRAQRGWIRGDAGVLFLLTWLVGGLALYYFAVMDRGAFNVRYASFITPALYLLMGLAIAEIGGRHWPRTVLAAAIVAGGLAAAARADLMDPAFFREDVSGVVEWLRGKSEPDDVILVDQRYPFGFYWPGFVDHPEQDSSAQPPASGLAQARYLFVDLNTLDARLNEYVTGAARVFWVQWFESDTDPRRGVYFLLDQVGERMEGRQFQGFSVAVWKVPPDAEFVLARAWQPVEVKFENAAVLLEAAIPDHLETRQLPVVLRWSAAQPVLPTRWKARVALYDTAGNRLAQSDERLLNDRHVFPSEWSDADAPLNVYMLALDALPPPGRYDVRVLVYDEVAPEDATWPHVSDSTQAVDGVELVVATVMVLPVSAPTAEPVEVTDVQVGRSTSLAVNINRMLEPELALD